MFFFHIFHRFPHPSLYYVHCIQWLVCTLTMKYQLLYLLIMECEEVTDLTCIRKKVNQSKLSYTLNSRNKRRTVHPMKCAQDLCFVVFCYSLVQVNFTGILWHYFVGIRDNCMITLIARFMGPTWGPSGADRTQVGPILAPCYLGTQCLSLWAAWTEGCWYQSENKANLRDLKAATGL